MAKYDHEILMQKAAEIKLLILDVDGVLTDGRLQYDSNGMVSQVFHVHDGHGLKLLMRSGVEVAILSSRTSEAVSARMKDLGISRVYQGKKTKIETFRQILAETGLSNAQAAFIGDDWMDLPVLKQVGLAVAVSNAHPPLSDHCHYVTQKPGGCGAVREVCDLILKAKGLWAGIFNEFLETV